MEQEQAASVGKVKEEHIDNDANLSPKPKQPKIEADNCLPIDTDKHNKDVINAAELCNYEFIKLERTINIDMPTIAKETQQEVIAVPTVTKPLRSHKRKQVVPEYVEIEAECRFCYGPLKKTFTKEELKRCKFYAHDDCKPPDRNICSACGQKFKTSKEYVKHLKTHKDRVIDTKILCDMCGMLFGQWSMFKRHWTVVHLDKKEHICNVCGKSFHLMLYLDNHMRVHTGEKPFKCKYCDRSFSLRYNMTVHMRLHTNTKPYECPHCPMVFRHNVSRKEHITDKHSLLDLPVHSTACS